MTALSAEQRVVITGFGAITALGHDIATTWQAIKQGQTGIDPITAWDTSNAEFAYGAEIKHYNPRLLIDDRKLLKLITKQDVLGLNAAKQAILQSEILSYRASLTDATEFNDRTGVYAGSAGSKYYHQYDFIPLLHQAAADWQQFPQHLFETVHPMWLLQILPNNTLAYIGIQHGFKGPNQNIVNHGVSGLQAIAEAFRAIQSGMIDRAVVVGYETAIEVQGQAYYASLGVLSRQDCKPFSANRDGTILAEGAGSLVLESERSATARGARIYGEILAASTRNEALGMISISDHGASVSAAMQDCLDAARLTPGDIGMITAHGNGTAISDASEANAITQLFSRHSVPVTAFKWAIGHALSAAGVIETIFTLLALNEAIVPGIANLTTVTDCQAVQVSNKPQTPRAPIGLIINRAFAGLSSCLLINRPVT